MLEASGWSSLKSLAGRILHTEVRPITVRGIPQSSPRCRVAGISVSPECFVRNKHLRRKAGSQKNKKKNLNETQTHHTNTHSHKHTHTHTHTKKHVMNVRFVAASRRVSVPILVFFRQGLGRKREPSSCEGYLIFIRKHPRDPCHV